MIQTVQAATWAVLAAVAFSTLNLDSQTSAKEPAPLNFTIERSVMTKGYDGKRCWVHARAGIVPGETTDAIPTVVLTTQPLMVKGSDVFYALSSSYTKNLGKTWTPLIEQLPMQRTVNDDQTEETTCDFTPTWHRKTGTLLGIGHTVRYHNNKAMKVRPRFTSYAVYDPSTNEWSKTQLLTMPDEPRFVNCGAGCVQRCDLPNGDVLLPVYFKEPKEKQFSVTVCLCHFDGSELTYVKHGTEMTVAVERGMVEPSVTEYGGRYYLTIRNDQHGYVTSSDDGLNYDEPKRWTFDDGSDLGNYNTQQHWLTHSDGLFLIYTRKGADNDHVFRHRAPLFMAQVDPENLTVIRSTEQIVVPERGARLGNFGVANVTPGESWVVVTEWMQRWGPDYVIPVDNKLGADNSIHVAKIMWVTPNKHGQ